MVQGKQIRNPPVFFGDLIFGILALGFLLIFAYSVSEYYTRAPSPGMSREILLGQVAYTGGPPILSVPSLDGTGFFVFVPDTDTTCLMRIDRNGGVMDRLSLKIDLSESVRMGAFQISSENLVLFHAGIDLRRVEINLSTNEITEETIVSGISGFTGNGPGLVIEKDGELFTWFDEKRRFSGPILTGSIYRYIMDASGESPVLAIVDLNENERYNLSVIRFTGEMEIADSVTILEDSSNEYFRKLSGVRVQSDQISLLSVFRNNRYGRNYITVGRFNLLTGQPITEFSTYVPLLNSEYHMVQSDPKSESFIMQYKTVFGYNLVEATISEDGETILRPLTKTRPMSSLTIIDESDDSEIVVFSDIEDGTSIILFAADNPQIVNETTKWWTTDWLNILGITLTHGLVSLFVCAIYIMIVVPPPLSIVGIIQRWMKSYRMKYHVTVGLGVIGYTALKLFVTSYFLKGTMQGRFMVPWVGDIPVIYYFQSFLSVVSYLLISSRFKSAAKVRATSFEVFIRFSIMDGILYSMSFLIYGVTAMLIDKM